MTVFNPGRPLGPVVGLVDLQRSDANTDALLASKLVHHHVGGAKAVFDLRAIAATRCSMEMAYRERWQSEIPIPTDETAAPTADGPFDFLKNWRRNAGLLGDMWGLRTALSHHRMSFAMEESSEVLENASSGGIFAHRPRGEVSTTSTGDHRPLYRPPLFKE